MVDQPSDWPAVPAATAQRWENPGQRLASSHVNVVSTYFYRRVRTPVGSGLYGVSAPRIGAGLIMHGTGHAGRGGPHFKLGARTGGRPRGCEAGVLSGRAGVTETDVINQEPHF